MTVFVLMVYLSAPGYAVTELMTPEWFATAAECTRRYQEVKPKREWPAGISAVGCAERHISVNFTQSK